MARFRVTFLKTVYNDTGHSCEICQRIVDVEAGDGDTAQEIAVRCFCDLESVTNWLHHADRLEFAELSPAS